MKVLKLILKNSVRHKLRTFLTILGISIAIIAFGLLRTVVSGWYSGIDASAADRLITRQAVSFIFTLPYAYKEKIESIPGVEKVCFLNWFQGVYIDKNQFFARLAVDGETIFDVYPEFLLTKKELENFKKERNSCIVGKDIAKTYNLKIGDIMTIEGDIYPGQWEFVIRGIYQPRDKTTDATQMLFHWTYLDERIKELYPGRAGEVGWYAVKISDPSKAAVVSEQIDNLFKNSRAETKTETERAFQQGFIQASSAIITSINVISYVIIGIIMLVLGNTMIMSARERTREYAVLKTLGFSGFHLTMLIFGESMIISLLGAGVGLFLLFPMVEGFAEFIPKGFFPVFEIETVTVIFALLSAIIIGIAASIFPIQKALRTSIVDGFRFVG
jgi:putative ABC transport system permease protein